MPSRLDISNALKIAIRTLGISVPAGAGAYLLRDYFSKVKDIPKPVTFADMPLISSVGPKRKTYDDTPPPPPGAKQEEKKKEKKAGIFSWYNDTFAPVAAMRGRKALDKYLLTGALGVLGSAAGYGLTGKYIQDKKKDGINEELNRKRELFNDLLLKEQLAAAKIKASDVLDEALTTIFDAAYHHEENAPLYKEAKDSTMELLKLLADSKYAPALFAAAGASVLGYHGWRSGVDTDKKRAVYDAMEDAIEQRLKGNPEGPTAPMVVKVKTDRVGNTPISGGAGKSYTRDVLSSL